MHLLVKNSKYQLILFIFIGFCVLHVISKPSSRLAGQCTDCVCGVRGRLNRIVGGSETLPHEQPWIASLRRQGKFYCGATIISRNYVITAAHCVYGFESKEIKIYMGGHDILRDYTDIRRIKKVNIHESFDIVTFNNDIALIEIDKPVEYGPHVQPACLPDGSTLDYAGQLTLVAGWGRVREGENTSKVLRSVVVPVWSREQCEESEYGKNRITENMMCGGYHNGGKDACQGDSGGPMLIEGVTGSTEIIGVVSWGRGCARPNLPGIYTRLVNYLEWIKTKIDGECLCQPKLANVSKSLE